MSTATARAYRSNFAGRFMPSGIRKSPEIKPFHECRSTYSRKAHCIKDRVLLDGTCGSGGLYLQRIDKIAELSIRKNYKASYETSNNKGKVVN